MLKKSLPPVFTQAVGRIKLSFKTNSVLCSPLQPSIPVPETKSQQSWYFDYLRKRMALYPAKEAKLWQDCQHLRKKANGFVTDI